MAKTIVPKNYDPKWDIMETEIAIKLTKDFFERELANTLSLTRISAPLFVKKATGLNDNLNGVERPVAFETKEVIQNGADEIDMVINVGALKTGNLDLVELDIRAVVEASGDKLVKVIIEACLLTDQEKVVACQLAQKAGADFVKTSTGFSTGGATVADVRLMRETVGPEMGVKAAGGARSYADALAFVEAGATRIGTSAGVAILKGELADGDY